MALGVGALPNRLVDYFAIVGLSEQTQLRPDVGVDSGAIEAELLTRYPPDHADFTLDEQMLPWLCFPSDVRITEEQRSPYHHMFVLTKVDGICVYGFCYVLSEPMVGAVDDGDLLCLRRYIPKAICLLSHYPLFSPFRKLLEHLRAFSKSPESLDLPLECIISQIIHDLPLPSAGGPPTQMALYEEDPIVFQRAPNTHIEPLRIPVRRLLSLLHLDNVLLVLNALLLERKIILLGDRPMQLTEVAEVFTQLLFPLHWPYVYIPCLPNHLEDVLEAPLPFIVGTSPENINLDALPEDALIVDLKNDEVFVPPGAFPELPARPAAVLRSSLKIAITDGDKLNDAVVDRTVQQAFLSFFVSVVHDCEAHCLVRSSSTVLSADASGDSLDGATNVRSFFFCGFAMLTCASSLTLKASLTLSPPKAAPFTPTFSLAKPFPTTSTKNSSAAPPSRASLTTKCAASRKTALSFSRRRRPTRFRRSSSRAPRSTTFTCAPSTATRPACSASHYSTPSTCRALRARASRSAPSRRCAAAA